MLLVWLYLCSCLDQVKSSVQEYINRMLKSEQEVCAIILAINTLCMLTVFHCISLYFTVLCIALCAICKQ